MPRSNVTDLITDQEMAFARLVLAGTMNDREAAQAAGLNPDTAAYTKAKPRVREYMIEHRAAVEQKLVEQEAEAQRQLNLGRERLLERLWEIADTSAEKTRGSFSSQVKALSMIGAIEGIIPDRRASSASPQRAETQSTPPTDKPQIYQAAWLAKQKEKAIHPEPSPAPAQEDDEPGFDEPEPEPAVGPGQSAYANRVTSSETTPDTRVPFSIKKNLFGRHR